MTATNGATLLAAMLLALPGAGAAASGAAAPAGEVSVVITLRSRADLRPFRGLPRAARRAGVVRALRDEAGRSQGGLRAHLALRRAEGRVSRVTPLWVSNSVSISASPEVVEELRSHPDVLSVTPDDVDVVPAGVPAGPPEPNLSAIRAPDLWSLGFLGQGAVVASLDTGVDPTNPDLAATYRGGSNSWYDPYAQHATPADLSGHGTWTMGVMVGRDAGGTAIGVAPDATWIAARIFDDRGRATATAIHLAFQWVLDPDGNPSTDDAPDFVNNSWSYGSPGCNLEFQPDLQALLAAGIVPVFAAGNYGPGAGSSVSPANYPEAFAVGAVDDTGAVLYDSSRGPSACGGGTFPTVVAPGYNILTTDRYGFYTYGYGTSLAAPHVTAALALLRSAYPSPTAAQLALALRQSAADIAPAGADNDTGSGLIDALAAYQLLASAPPPPPPPPPPPVAADDAYSLAEDTSATFTAPGVLGNDTSPSGAPLAAELVSGTSHGALSLQASGAFSYTPAAGYYGSDSFSYRASDGVSSSDAATVSLTIAHVNRAPVAVNDSATTSRNTARTIQVLANDYDTDGTLVASTVTITTQPRYGKVSVGSTGTVVYTPNRSFRGTDSFRYTVKDDKGATSNVATVTVKVG